MLLTETNKTQPGGLGQHLNPSDSSEGSWLLEMCTQQTALEIRITQTSPTIESRSLCSRRTKPTLRSSEHGG